MHRSDVNRCKKRLNWANFEPIFGAKLLSFEAEINQYYNEVIILNFFEKFYIIAKLLYRGKLKV